MKTCLHTYPTLRDAVVAVLRIYQPLNTQEIVSHLNSWKHAGQLGFPYFKDGVQVMLHTLQEDGKVNYVGGVWRLP